MKRVANLITGTVFFTLTAGLLPAAEYPYANPADELAKIPWLKETERGQGQVWRTQYDASQPERAYPGRIVSYAGKWTRHSFGGHGGMGSLCGWRYAKGPLVPGKADTEIGQLTLNEVDVDGDGSTADDFVFSLVYSLDVPLSIPDWPAACVFPERLSSTFYGGATYYCGNNDFSKTWNFSGEMGINPDHSPPFFDCRAEDHPINGQKHPKIPDSFLRHYVTMIWKKADFLNNGNKYRVSFDDSSRLAILCTRGYWYGWNDIRFVVQNGDTLYISEIMPDIPDYAFKDASKLGKPSGFLPVCYPSRVKWAVYRPEGYKVDFDPAKAGFATVQFDDVQAVGWYLAKTDNSPAQTHCKWYGFECDAVVHTPSEPSPNLEMKPVKAAGVPEFYMAVCELPYNLWRDIYRWGDSPSHVLQARYIYEKSGSMGSMGYGKREHGHDEPLTDLSFYDMLALCNTLSEMEGKAPCYYLDPEFKTIFRNQHIATYASLGKDGGEYVQLRNFKSPVCEEQPVPKIYVNWAADGHRLPTAAEWIGAAGPLQPGSQTADGTQPVGTGSPNSSGLYDMDGNVRELVWTFGDVYDPETSGAVTAMGSDFTGTDSSKNPSSPYGDTPYDGDPRIGVRLVCRESGLAAPPMDAAASAPRWTFRKGDVTAAQKKTMPVKEPVLTLAEVPGGSYIRHDKKEVSVAPFSMAKYETSFDLWKTVRQWAEANGYSFYKNGDMGSMYFFDFTHSPDEPVTHLTWFDMITWCNALSEMEGRTPCYYEDEACTKVIRKAFAYRPIKLDGWEYIQTGGHPLIRKYLDGSYAKPFIFTRWDTDGYRLPTAAEMDYAIRGGIKTAYFWGDNENGSDEYVWEARNSGGRTHPVGQKKPNPFGLYDIQGNAKEWLFSNGKRRDDSRPYDRDLDNPIHSPFYGYKKPASVFAPIQSAVLVGPCWMYGGKNINGQHGVGVESGADSDLTHYYSDIGFRVVRCAAGTHPRDGLRPLAEEKIVQHLQIKKEEFNNFEGSAVPTGAIYRATLTRSGVFNRTGVVRQPALAWRTELGGEIKSSPVVYKNTLYIGSPQGFHALDAATGAVKWTYPSPGGVESSACVTDGIVVFTTIDNRLVALNPADGTEKWVYKGQAAEFPARSSPALVYGTVLSVVGREIAAFDPATGKKIYSISKNVPMEFCSVVCTPDEFYAAGTLNWGYCFAYDYTTARVNWRSVGPFGSGAGVYFYKTPAVDTDGSIYFNETRRLNKFHPGYQGNAPDGERGRIWGFFLLDKEVDDNELIAQSCPTPYNGLIYAGRKDGKFAAVDAKSGNAAWMKKYSAACLSDPSVAAPSGLVIFGCYDGLVRALDCVTGDERWTFDAGGRIFSSPWIADGAVYISTEQGTVLKLK